MIRLQTKKIAAWDERLKAVFNRGFGMATIWDNAWANGHGIMVRPLRNVKSMWAKVSNTSPISVSLSSW